MDAVLPLVGVVIGAVIGAAMTLLLDRRRERRAARAGLRLVGVELRLIQSSWRYLADEWNKDPTAETAEWVASKVQEHPFETLQWTNQRELLAASLSDDDWKALSDAYAVITLTNEAPHRPDAEGRSELAKLMNDNRPYVDRAVERLRRWMGPSLVPSH